MIFGIKNRVVTENNVFLAPLAGVTDYAFRRICKLFNVGMMTTEMVSSKGIVFKNEKTLEMLKTDDFEHPLGLQLFGDSPKFIAEAIGLVDHLSFDFIDLNMGCPAPKIFNNGEGSALMDSPDLVGKIVEAASSATNKPITIKIRKGTTKEKQNAVEIAKIAEQAGASAICVHGRLRTEYYFGNADLDIIKAVKSAVSIPVIGNGDITDTQSAKNMLETTKCDAIAIGRAAMGNPWLFREIIAGLSSNEPVSTNEVYENEVPAKERMEMALLHTDLLTELKGEFIAAREMRKHISWYTKGLKHSAALRQLINKTQTIKELKACIKTLS